MNLKLKNNETELLIEEKDIRSFYIEWTYNTNLTGKKFSYTLTLYCKSVNFIKELIKYKTWNIVHADEVIDLDFTVTSANPYSIYLSGNSSDFIDFEGIEYSEIRKKDTDSGCGCQGSCKSI